MRELTVRVSPLPLRLEHPNTTAVCDVRKGKRGLNIPLCDRVQAVERER